MVRGYRRKGDYAAAQQALNQKLELARKDRARPAIANSYGELARRTGWTRRSFPRPWKQYEDAIELYGTTTTICDRVLQ